jgi:hypothetical protein
VNARSGLRRPEAMKSAICAKQRTMPRAFAFCSGIVVDQRGPSSNRYSRWYRPNCRTEP